MKTTKIIYWTSTVIFAALMISTAIPDIIMMEDAVKFIRTLGYPDYFIPFIGYAKVLGGLAILVPTFDKIKEWAYAGLFFDLIGAVYSNVMTSGWDPGMAAMLLFFGAGICSYIYNEKYKKLRNA